MNELISTRQFHAVTDLFCRQCGGRLETQDNFCGECGTGCELIEIVDPESGTSVGFVAAAPSNAILANDETQAIKAFLKNRLAVVGMIALIGPLGLPALWFSSRFATRTKVITTSAYVLLTTIVPLAIAWYWLDYSLRPLVDAFGQ